MVEFPSWFSGLRTQCCLEDMGSIPGLTQWVKYLALPQAVTQVIDVAQIRCCCGCGVGPSCSTNLTPSLGTDVAVKINK